METVLVAGASGVVGRSAALAFAAAGFHVLAVSRRDPRLRVGDGAIAFLPLDLSDESACRSALEGHPAPTHLVYAAVDESEDLVSGWYDADRMARNAAMLANILGAVREGGALRHVSLLQGGKAYGAHVHPVALPSREDGPRDDHANVYWLWEDAIRAAAAQDGFGWTVLRPPIIVGGAIGAAMNPIVPLTVMAALCRERGTPFDYPGFDEPGGGRKIVQMVDARVVADALVWSARASAARNRIFNVDNGDLLEWHSLWPDIARAMGVAAGEGPHYSFVTRLEGAEEEWAALCERSGLVQPDLGAMLGRSHHYADVLFGPGGDGGPPLYMSPIAIRQAGFASFMDSRGSILAWIADLQRRRLIPSP